MKLSAFPRGRLIKNYEKRVLSMKEELRPMVDELSWRVHSYWQQEQDDLLLWKASTELSIAGLSLQGDPVLIGNVVLSRMSYYWGWRELISIDAEHRVRELYDSTLISFLDQAKKIDILIRRELGQATPCGGSLAGASDDENT
jgi:hypothetical protein